MNIFDLMTMEAESYDNRAVNVFFQNETFKTRIIVLGSGGKIPACQMGTYVIFLVVEGEVVLKKNNVTSVLKKDQVFISEPACLSMESSKGARLMGIQIKKKD